MGRIHARILSDMGVLVGVADKDRATARKVAKEHNTTAFSDFESMLKKTIPDGVIIATPTATHAEIAHSIATDFDGIKGILIEKPLASTLKDGKKVAETVRTRGIVTLISHSEIYNPIVGRALSLIASDAIGTPQTRVCVTHENTVFG